MIEKLENALVSVFPPVTIDRAMIDGRDGALACVRRLRRARGL
jgi:hypothetical protein